MNFVGSSVQMKIDGEWVAVGTATSVTFEASPVRDPVDQASLADLMRTLKSGITFETVWCRPPRRLRKKADFVPPHSKGLRNRWGTMK